MQVLVEPVALCAYDGIRIDLTTVEAQHQLDEKFIALMVARYAGGIPLDQLRTAVRCQTVNAFLGPAILLDSVAGDESGFFQASQRIVNLGGLHLPDRFTTDERLKSCPQFVPVTGLVGQQAQDRVPHRHDSYPQGPYMSASKLN